MLAPLVRVWQINHKLVLKLAIVSTVLLLSAYLGRRASLNQLSLLLALLAVGGALVLIRKPELGLLAILVTALSVPFTIGTDSNTPIHGPVILIPAMLGIWIVDRIQKRNMRIVSSPINLPLAALVLSATISFLAGGLPWNYFVEPLRLQPQIGGWMIFVLSAGIFLLMANLIKELQWLKIITYLFLALGAIAVLGRAIPEVSTLGAIAILREAHGGLLWMWIVALAGGQAMFNHALSRLQRFTLMSLAVVTIGVFWFFARDWISGWLPSMAVMLTLIWMRSWRLGVLVGIAGAGLIILRYPDVFMNLMEGDQYSISTREVAVQIILTQVVPLSPIIGLGPSNYYHYTQLYPILGYYVNFNSHNQYVDIVAQTGLLGLAVFVWLMATMARTGWVLRRQVTDGFARAYVYGCLGGLAGTLVASALGDWFLPFVYNIGLGGFRSSMLAWMFLGGMVAVGHIATRTASKESVA